MRRLRWLYLLGGLVRRRGPVCFVTLTEGGDPRSGRESSKALTRWLKGMDRRVGRYEAYAAVPELQNRGAVHWHLLVAGWAYSQPVTTRRATYEPHPVGAGVAITKTTVRYEARREGFGQWVGVVPMAGGVGDSMRSAAYLSALVGQYLSKEDAPEGLHAVRASRGDRAWWPGVGIDKLRCGLEVDPLMPLVEAATGDSGLAALAQLVGGKETASDLEGPKAVPAGV